MRGQVAGALALAGALVVAAPQDARGATTSSLGEAALYGGTSVAAGFTTIGCGVGLLYDAPVSRGWRIAGGITGAAAITLGTVLLVDRHGTTTSVTLGAIPLTLGVTSILTALLVDEPERDSFVVPYVLPDGSAAGASLLVRF